MDEVTMDSDATADPFAKLRCAVLIENGKGGLDILWSNGDEGVAQRKAEEWCSANPGLRAWVTVATSASPCKAELQTKWRGA